MTTVSDFKAQHNLSDRNWRTLKAKVQAQLERDITTQIDSKTFEIDPEAEPLLIGLVGTVNRPNDKKTSAIVPINAEFVDNQPGALAFRGYAPVETEETVELLEASLIESCNNSNQSQNAGYGALIKQSQNNGKKLGAVLAKVEIEAALQEKGKLVNQWLEAAGLQSL